MRRRHREFLFHTGWPEQPILELRPGGSERERQPYEYRKEHSHGEETADAGALRRKHIR